MVDELFGFTSADTKRISRTVRHFEAGGGNVPRGGETPGGEVPPTIRAILLEDLLTDNSVSAALLKHETTNEIQDVSLVGDVAGGSFLLTFLGENTAAIPFNATAIQMREALELLDSINAGDVAVSAFPGRWRIEFTGQYAGVDVELMTSNGGSLTPGNTDFANTVVVAVSMWEDSGQVLTVRAGVPVSVPTPLVAGATVVAVWHHGAGYLVVACEPRDFFFYG